jgi:hypothetical protein
MSEPNLEFPKKDGHYWFRNFVGLKEGGYHFEWRIARVTGDDVLILGHSKPIKRTDRYFDRAWWGEEIVMPPVTSSSGCSSEPAPRTSRNGRGGDRSCL